LIRLEQIGTDAKIAGGGGHTIGELALGTVVIDRAAAGRPAHEADTERATCLDVDVTPERLAVAERDGGRRPREEPQRRR
jgi:hypothetical protein